MYEKTPVDTIVSLHLPYFNTSYMTAMLAEKWMAYGRPTIVACREFHPLDYRTANVQGDNSQQWISFHKGGHTPIVPAAYLAKHPQRIMKKLAETWNVVNFVVSHKVPNAERGKDGEGKQLRVQQMRGASVLKVINQFSRATKWEPQVIILDPFAGAGGTAVAAKLAGCYFIGMDKNKECVDTIEGLWEKLGECEGYENGAGLRVDLVKEDDEEEAGDTQGYETRL
jgi:hypothetical protein